jgi:hypothetical protein
MGFRIVEGKATGGARTIWVAGDGSSTYAKGQLVSVVAASKAEVTGTVVPLAVPAGVMDLTNFQQPFGVVMGFNERTPTWSSTLLTETAGGAIATQAAQVARDPILSSGMYKSSDPQLLMKVALIDPWTVLEGPIFNAAIGTAPTVVSSTAADTTGFTTAGTTGACDFTPVANLCTIYCRTGANAGLYRVTNDVTNTAPDVTVAFPYDVAIGDTFVRVPFKQGNFKFYISGPGLYMDCSKTPATHHFSGICYKLDLRDAGKETIQFSFSPAHWNPEAPRA